MEEKLIELVSGHPVLSVVFMVLGLLVALAQVIIPLTPTKRDDEILNGLLEKTIFKKIFDILLSFAPIQKKSDGYKLSKDE
jgi:hypothetical protein